MPSSTNYTAGLLALATAGSLVLAQFPHSPEGVTVLKSKYDPDVTISFKEVSVHSVHQSKAHGR